MNGQPRPALAPERLAAGVPLGQVIDELGLERWYFVTAGSLRVVRAQADDCRRESVDGRAVLVLPSGVRHVIEALHIAAAEAPVEAADPDTRKGATVVVRSGERAIALDEAARASLPRTQALRRGQAMEVIPLWRALEALGIAPTRAVRVTTFNGQVLVMDWPAPDAPRWRDAVLFENRRGGLHLLVDALPVDEAGASGERSAPAEGSGAGRGMGSQDKAGAAKDLASTGELRHIVRIDAID